MTMFAAIALSALVVVPSLLPASHSHSPCSMKASARHTTCSQEKRLALLSELIQKQAWPELSAQIKIGAESQEITIQDLQTLSLTHPGTPFALAVEGTKNILSLHEKTGLHLKVIFPIVLFAETSLNQECVKGTDFWPENRFGREVQYDPTTHRLFIHLGTKGVKPIGQGRRRIVTKTILYDRSRPEVMARGVTDRDSMHEFLFFRDCNRFPNVVRAEALMKHKTPDGKTISTVVTKIYRPGSLQKVLDDHSLKLTFKEKLKIACDTIKGLAALHSDDSFHRDIEPRNILVQIDGTKPNQRQIVAVIADLARVAPLFAALKVSANSNASYLSPEGFFRKRMMAWDYADSDIFALGCVMWQLLYGDMPAWGKKRYFRHEELSLKKRYAKHVALLRRTRSRPLKYLRAKLEKKVPLTVRDRFLALILQMTDPVPTNRGSAWYLRTQFEALYKDAK